MHDERMEDSRRGKILVQLFGAEQNHYAAESHATFAVRTGTTIEKEE
jgi:hypothetical protein